MPIYAYKCPQCGKEFEKLLPLSRRDEPVHCEFCMEKEVRRSAASFASAIGSSGAVSQGSCNGGGGGFT